jgi:hypothetical protein
MNELHQLTTFLHECQTLMMKEKRDRANKKNKESQGGLQKHRKV